MGWAEERGILSGQKVESASDLATLALTRPATRAVPVYAGAVQTLTHEEYLHIVRQVLAARLNATEEARLLEAELFYGAGEVHVYGTCFYDRWTREGTHDVIEISAFCEESLEQLWETLAHECAHVLAGWSAGHGSQWKSVAKRLGLRNPTAAGPARIEDMDPDLIWRLRQIPVPQDGTPVNRSVSVIRTGGTTSGIEAGSRCPLGIGTQGGTSRGPGSGSRLRLYMCECERPFRIRVASDDFQARCLKCESVFQRVTTTERRPPRRRPAGARP